jgi:mono/diheme cytochrome c family protein
MSAAKGSALANHTPEQVRAQVRSLRTGTIMPAFDEALLGDDDLEAVIAFIGGLEGEGHGHVEAEEAERVSTLEMHHWMAISAVKAGNVDEARHHVWVT